MVNPLINIRFLDCCTFAASLSLLAVSILRIACGIPLITGSALEVSRTSFGVGALGADEVFDVAVDLLTTAWPQDGQCFQLLSISSPHLVQKAMRNSNPVESFLEDLLKKQIFSPIKSQARP